MRVPLGPGGPGHTTFASTFAVTFSFVQLNANLSFSISRVLGNQKQMAESVLLLYLLLVSRPGIGRPGRKNRYRRAYSLLKRESSYRSRRARLFRSSWTAILILPPFQELVRCLRSPRRFWAAPRYQGFWEKDVCDIWKRMRNVYPDWEDKQYLQHYRMMESFWYLCERYGQFFKKETTNMRQPLTPGKRLAIVLHWLAQGSSYFELAALYAVGKSTVVAVVHDIIDELHQTLVPVAIGFPTGQELDQVIVDFEDSCGVPMCAGALDGTFMGLKTPTEYGYTYYCYKKFISIIVLAYVHARGILTSVNSGRPGSVGDSYTYRHSEMYRHIKQGE